jgi:hypothetical protein
MTNFSGQIFTARKKKLKTRRSSQIETMSTAALPVLFFSPEEDSSLPSDIDFQALNSISRTSPSRKIIGLHVAPRELVLEPVGPHFLAHARRKRHNRTFSEDEKHQAEIHASSLEDRSGNVSEDDEPEDPGMLARDPKEWKVRLHTRSTG